MKNNKKKRSAKVPFRRILLLALAIYLSALVIPFLSHKEVSDAFRRQFEKRAFYNDTPRCGTGGSHPGQHRCLAPASSHDRGSAG